MLNIVQRMQKLKRLFFSRSGLAAALLGGILLVFPVSTTQSGTPPLSPEQIQALIPQTVAALNEGRYDDAVRTAQALTVIFPKQEKAYEMLVTALWAKKDMQGVIQAALRAEANGIQNSLLYLRMAEAFFMTGRPDATLASLSRYEKAWRQEHA